MQRQDDPALWGPIEPAALMALLMAEDRRSIDAANRSGHHPSPAHYIAWQRFNAQRQRGKPINPRGLPWHANTAVRALQLQNWRP
jgi:hypothetical protein